MYVHKTFSIACPLQKQKRVFYSKKTWKNMDFNMQKSCLAAVLRASVFDFFYSPPYIYSEPRLWKSHALVAFSHTNIHSKSAIGQTAVERKRRGLRSAQPRNHHA
jgi:hypothetical protein